MKRIVLASSSPRRKDLMEQIIGKNFEIVSSSYEETNFSQLPPQELAVEHALGKARDVAGDYGEGLILGADTFVTFDGKIMGKPEDEKDAKNMLETISGKNIEVISGIALIDVGEQKEYTDLATTVVKIKDLEEKEIQNYIQTGEPMGKVGAIAIQGKGTVFVESLQGCYFNVVAIPLYRLNLLLKKLGVSVFDYQ